MPSAGPSGRGQFRCWTPPRTHSPDCQRTWGRTVPWWLARRHPDSRAHARRHGLRTALATSPPTRGAARRRRAGPAENSWPPSPTFRHPTPPMFVLRPALHRLYVPCTERTGLARRGSPRPSAVPTPVPPRSRPQHSSRPGLHCVGPLRPEAQPWAGSGGRDAGPPARPRCRSMQARHRPEQRRDTLRDAVGRAEGLAAQRVQECNEAHPR